MTATIAEQLLTLGFTKFTVWGELPKNPPEEGRVRVIRGPYWIDVNTASNAAIVVPDYATIIATVVPVSKDDSDTDAVKRMAQVANFVNLSPGQIDAFIDANVTDLAGAKAMLKVISKALSISARVLFK